MRMSARHRLLAYGLFLASGATALIYQVVWIRTLTLTVGASFEAVSIVLGAFMGGLALGGVVLGRFCQKVERPLRLYGLLELGVAAFALALIYLLPLSDRIYVEIARSGEGVSLGLQILRAAMAFALLVLPTFFMGGTLPVLTHYLARHHREFAPQLSGLYAINTGGAVLGTLAAGFVLLPRFGVVQTTAIAIAANVAIGVLAILVDRRPAAVPPSEPVATPAAPEPATAAAHDYRWALKLSFLGTAISGMGALALEVIWSRAIAIASGSTTYSATIMLTAFLVGIALGSALHAAFPLRRVNESVQLGVVLVLIGLCALVTSELISRLPEYSTRISLRFYDGLEGVRLGNTFALSFLVMLAPCVLMGVAFPLAGQARARLKSRFGESVGDLVGLNTTGAILGSIGAGFLLVPGLGIQRSTLVVSSLYLSWGLLILCAVLIARRPRARGATVGLATGGVALAWFLPTFMPPWDPRLLAAFENNKTGYFVDGSGRIDMQARLVDTRLLYHSVGRSAMVTVTDHGGVRSVVINGKSVATDNIFDLHHEYLLGHLPVLLHPSPRSAVVVGLGAGLTLGGVTAHDSLERIVIVEIEPTVEGAAREFADLNDAALDDARVEFVIQDGRNYLKTTSERFDVITADPHRPGTLGAAYLYTREYYRLVAERLAEGGVMCQWLPLYELDLENVRSVMATFAEAFPHTTVWEATFDVLLIGSDKPLRVDLEDLERRIAAPKVARQLGRVGLGDALSFLGEFLIDEDGHRRYCEGGRVNTDDNLYLEFSAPFSIGRPVVAPNIDRLAGFLANPSYMVVDSRPRFATRELLAAELARVQTAKVDSVRASREWFAASQSKNRGEYERALATCRKAVAEAPAYGRARHVLAGLLTDVAMLAKREGDDARAASLLKEALAADPLDPMANFQVGADLLSAKRLQEAIPYFERTLERRPRFPDAWHSLGWAQGSLNQSAEAVASLQEAVSQRPGSAVFRHNLGNALVRLGRLDEAIPHMQEAVELAPQQAEYRRDLGDALARARRPREAAATLEEGLARAPEADEHFLRLSWICATSNDVSARDGRRALELAQRLTQRGENARRLDVLAAALAETGSYEQAAEVAGRAMERAKADGQERLHRAIEERRVAYRAGRAYRE